MSLSKQNKSIYTITSTINFSLSLSFRSIILLLFLNQLFLATTFGLAIPDSNININKRSTKQQSRVVKKQLSDDEHFQDLDHDGQAEVHNRDFDHGAFLGSVDEANEFDQLTPEESKSRLAKIVDRIDVNHDDNVTESELKNWIYNSQKKYILEDVQRQWAAHTDNDPNTKLISWEKFRNKTYGFIHEISKDRQSDDLKTYADMQR